MEEKWKDIEGYEGLYQVSNIGRVKSLERTRINAIGSKRKYKECILKPLTSKQKKYYHVSLYKNGKQKLANIHRIVAINFVPNPQKNKEVNHIDGDPSNNKSTNLEWCTSSENQLHAYRAGLQKPKYKEALAMAVEKLKKKVVQLDMGGNYINTYGSLAEAERETGAKASNISKVVRGARPNAGGFKWVYQNEFKESDLK